MSFIKTSPTFRCAECKSRLLEIRRNEKDSAHDLRCPRCDRDLLEKETR